MSSLVVVSSCQIGKGACEIELGLHFLALLRYWFLFGEKRCGTTGLGVGTGSRRRGGIQRRVGFEDICGEMGIVSLFDQNLVADSVKA